MTDSIESIIIKRYQKHKIEYQSIVHICEVLGIDYNAPLHCYYCGKLLKAVDVWPFKDVISVDHKTPKSKGGANTLENTCLCCCECNIIKGTASSESFKFLIGLYNDHPIERQKLFNEWYIGRYKNMRERRQ